MDAGRAEIAYPLRGEAISANPASISRRFCCSFRKDFPNRSLVSTAANKLRMVFLRRPQSWSLSLNLTTGIEELNN